MKFFTKLTMLALLGLVTVNVTAEDQGLTIMDRGMDDNRRYYVFGCHDAEYTSGYVEFELDEPVTAEAREARSASSYTAPKIKQICISPRNGAKVCKSTWDLQQAAIESCK
jgi:hypothetical protein